MNQPTQPKKTKSEWKKRMIAFGIMLFVLAVGAFSAVPLWNHFNSTNSPDDANNPLIAQTHEQVDFDRESGALYINNEVIVMTVVGTTQAEVEALAREFHGSLASGMEDIGFWQLRFDDAMAYDDLNSLIKKIKRSEIVEGAYINAVFEPEHDIFSGTDEPRPAVPTANAPETAPSEAPARESATPTLDDRSILDDEATPVETPKPKATAEPFQTESPSYPSDPWDGDIWNIDVPRGKNWGMEAIHAPAAWGYRARMRTVNVGLIDSTVNTSHEDINASLFITLVEPSEDGPLVSTQQYTSDDDSADFHGTHVAGTIAAPWNTVGVTGVMGTRGNLFYSAAYDAKDGKAIEDYYTAYNYILAIKNLVDRDVKAINISQNTSRLIGFAASRGNLNAINHLQTQATIAEAALKRMIESGQNFVICVAAGNSNSTTYYKADKKTYGYKENAFWPWELFSGEKGGSQAKYNNFLNLISDPLVKDCIIVVGSVGIDSKKSTSTNTRYQYSEFSNIGDRVDIVAPGEDIYSTNVTGYTSLRGTSMAAPHVTGVAGLVFACNPALSGADVKNIVLASTTSRFYYEGGYSGMVNAETAVINALQTQDHSVNRVIKRSATNGLDLCFVVDTTGSMGDDIANAKENMNRILDELSLKNEDFRVALIDYRDFADRGSSSQDYPAKLQMAFSNDKEEIIAAINALDLGHGGDTNETVYSGLIMAVGLSWRTNAQKAIIVLGDAPPLDPEPNTGYTFNSVLAALYNADIAIDIDASDDRVLGEGSDSLIKVFTIGTDASAAAEEFFQSLSEGTGGTFIGVDSAAEVSDAIIDSIEQIELTPTKTVNAQFGDAYSNETIEIYQNDQFMFEITLDKSGAQTLADMELDRFSWKIPRLNASGTIKVSENGKSASIDFDNAPWYSFAIRLWQRDRVMLISCCVGGVILLIVVLIAVKKVRKVFKPKTPAPATPAELAAPMKPTPSVKFFCPHCGEEYDSAVRFCGKCGNKTN